MKWTLPNFQFHEGIRWGLQACAVLSVNVSSRSAIDQIQRDRLHRFIELSVSQSPIYARMVLAYRDGGPDHSPLLHVTKAELMTRFGEWVLDRDVHLSEVHDFLANPKHIGKLFLDRYYLWESSGSSGVPGIFLQDARAMAIYDSLEWGRINPLDFWRLNLNPLSLGKKVAFIGVLNGHFASLVTFSRYAAHLEYGHSRMRALSILLPIDQLIKQLNAFAPDIVATYPSMASELASYSVSGELRIAPSDMFLGGEMLGAETRLGIQNAFACQVHNQYGASEFLPIAWECSLGSLHVNSDWVILEPVDRHYRLVEKGEAPYTTLITNLANYVQPIYRYDIGDRVIFHREQCACGSAFPTIDVIGRSDDVIQVFNAKGKSISLLPLAITTLIEECGIYDFQLRYSPPDHLVLKLAGAHRYSKKQEQQCRVQLERYLINMGLEDIALTIEPVPHLEISRSGKVQRIYSERKNNAQIDSKSSTQGNRK